MSYETGRGAETPLPDETETWRQRADRPVFNVTLWPHRSLPRQGFHWMMGFAAAGLSVPLLAALGTPVFWGLLPFTLVPLLLLWLAYRRNNADARLTEELSIWRDELRIERREPRGHVRRWQADPMAVRIRLYENGKVEQYLTLSAAGREIELGAFLAPEERIALAEEVESAITRALRGER